MDLSGKVAIVTGSSRGLGKAMALAFAGAGASVVVAARSEEPRAQVAGTIGETAEEIRKAGGTAIAVRCDVSVGEELHNLVERSVQEFGQIDVLVHNAAARIPGGIMDLTLRRWEIQWSVNLWPLFVLAKEVVPSMQAHGGGHILDIAPAMRLPDPSPQGSGAGGGGGQIGGLPKQWASQLAMAMAQELAPHHIAVNCLFPAGPRNTEGMQVATGGNYGNTSPRLFADAALAMVSRDPTVYTGRCVTDEQVLKEEGITDFSSYLENPDIKEPDRYSSSS